jgi:membrane-associated phospholipid phosphatase
VQAWPRPTGATASLRRATDGVVATISARPGWAILAVATLALTSVAAGDGTLPGDVAVTRAVQDFSFPGWAVLTKVVNTAGGTTGILLVTLAGAYLLARRGQGAAALVLLGAFALRCGNALIKMPVESPRPTPSLVRVAETSDGYGFPSAHVMGVVLLYGALLLLAPELIRCRVRRGLLRAAALLMLLTIGYGRIAAGAHWPSDVLGAYLLGVLGLAGLLALYRACRTGRLPDPTPGTARVVVLINGAASLLARVLLPAPARRPAAQVVPARVAEQGVRKRR